MSMSSLAHRVVLSLAAPLVSGAVVMFSPPAVHAAEATATVDWGAMSIDLVGTDYDNYPDVSSVTIPLRSRTHCTQEGVSSCPSPAELPTSYGDPAPVATVTGDGHGGFARFTDDDRLDTALTGTLPGTGSLSVQTTFEFSFFVAGPAVLTFRLPYTLYVDDWGGGSSFAEVGLWTGSTNPRVTLDSAIDGRRERRGALTGVINATEPFWTASFIVDTVSGLRNTVVTAPVPEPGTALLMLAGLAAVGAVTRTFRTPAPRRPCTSPR